MARRYGLTELVDQKRADGLDQRVFAGEVVQQRAVIDAGFTRDVGKSQPFEAALGDQAVGDADDRRAPIRALGGPVSGGGRG